MAEKIGLGAGFDAKEEDKWKFKVKQDMHFKNFYRSLNEFLQDNKYKSQYNDSNAQIYETFYDEKIKSDGEKEYRLRWRAYYITDNPTYVILKYTFDWQVLYCKDKKIVIDGKKLTIQNMELEITCKTSVLVNKNNMKKKKFLGPFSKLFFDRWFRYLYEGYKGEAKRKSKEIEEKIKALLDIAKYTNTGFEFNRQQGFQNPNKLPQNQ